jgi:shikimate kinase / 3-dehydroquinate synthase
MIARMRHRDRVRLSGSDTIPFITLEPVVHRDPDAVRRVTTRSIEIKADIVSRDEREQGDRVVLNYGHTFAHAIELIRGLATDDQGEAVALGMMAAAHLAFRQGRISSAVVDQ